MDLSKLDFSQIPFKKNVPLELVNLKDKEMQPIHFMNKMFMRFHQKVKNNLNFLKNVLFLSFNL